MTALRGTINYDENSAGLNLPALNAPTQGRIATAIGNTSGGVAFGGGSAFGGGYNLVGPVMEIGTGTQSTRGPAPRPVPGPAPAPVNFAPQAAMPAPPQMTAPSAAPPPSAGGMTPQAWANYTGQARPGAPAAQPVGAGANPYKAPTAGSYIPPVNPFTGLGAPTTQQAFGGSPPIASGPSGVPFNAMPAQALHAQQSPAQQQIAGMNMPGAAPIMADNSGRGLAMVGHPPATQGRPNPEAGGRAPVNPGQNPVQQRNVQTPKAKPYIPPPPAGAGMMVFPPDAVPPEPVNMGQLQPIVDPRAIRFQDVSRQVAATMATQIANSAKATASDWIKDYKDERNKLEGAIDKFRDEMLAPYGKAVASFDKPNPGVYGYKDDKDKEGYTPRQYMDHLKKSALDAMAESEKTIKGVNRQEFVKAAAEMASDEPMLQKKYTQGVLVRDLTSAYRANQEGLAARFTAQAEKMQAEHNANVNAWETMATKLNEMGQKRLEAMDNAAAKILEAHKFASEAERLMAQTYVSGLTTSDMEKFRAADLEIKQFTAKIQGAQLDIAAQEQKNKVAIQRAERLEKMIASERGELKRLEPSKDDRAADRDRKNAERAKVQSRLDALLKLQE